MVKNNNYDIGIDATNIKRFEKVSQHFIKRILTNNEYQDYLLIENQQQKLKFLASRWSLKEAVFKVVGNTEKAQHFINIEFYSDDNNKVFCKTYPNIKVSLTYVDNIVCSIALYCE